MRNLLPLIAVVPLAACSNYGEARSTPAPEPEPQYVEREAGADYPCDASGLQEHIGHKATAESGAKLLELSGARVLRWGPPDSAWTMDYRQDRLNVSYDREMTITKIGCG